MDQGEGKAVRTSEERQLPGPSESLLGLQNAVRRIGARYINRLDRARRLFIEERACALTQDREAEYDIKSEASRFFNVSYSSIAFAGSAQLGFSIPKERLFVRARSDLDIACISPTLFQESWTDVISTTRAFTDETKFSGLQPDKIKLFKESILRRGMIKVRLMPRSALSLKWQSFEDRLSRKHSKIFGSVSVAVYLNEYAFCWKQDAALDGFLR